MHYVNAQDDYINFQVYFILKGDKITLLHIIYISTKIESHSYMYDRW